MVQGTLYRRLFDEPHPGECGTPTRERSKGGVAIGSDVWIADNVTILSGVTIGDGCCIGAGSIVTRSLSPYTVAAGSPCRPIRSRFPDEVIRLLLDVQWWTWSEERIGRNRAFFRMNLAQTSAENIRASIFPDRLKDAAARARSSYRVSQISPTDPPPPCQRRSEQRSRSRHCSARLSRGRRVRPASSAWSR